jgi:hypothetical protein
MQTAGALRWMLSKGTKRREYGSELRIASDLPDDFVQKMNGVSVHQRPRDQNVPLLANKNESIRSATGMPIKVRRSSDTIAFTVSQPYSR